MTVLEWILKKKTTVPSYYKRRKRQAQGPLSYQSVVVGGEVRSVKASQGGGGGGGREGKRGNKALPTVYV